MKPVHARLTGMLLMACGISISAHAAPDFGRTSHPDVPERKWFNDADGYRDALALQEKTGVEIFLYFYRHDLPDEKGLCSWFEKRGLQEGDVKKLLETYIKVQVQLPIKKKDQPLFSTFRFNKCPAVFIVPPNGWSQRCQVFDWDNRRPKLKEQDVLVQEILTKTESAKVSNNWRKPPDPSDGE